MATTKDVLDKAEKDLDSIEEVLDTMERIPKAYLNGTTKQQAVLILGTTAVVAAAASGFVTYKLTRKKLRAHYEAIAEKEISEARNYYITGLDKDDMTPQEAVEKLVPSTEQLDMEIKKLDYTSAEKLPDPEEVVDEDQEKSDLHNIFTDAEVPAEGFDYEAELEKRSEEAPYIITVQEYMEGEKGYEQETLTYFEGDDVLADQRDAMVEEVEATVGHDNLEKFGYGSNDRNIVYVRNDRQELDMEIIRSHGDFAKEVLGFQEKEIKHSDKRRPRRMRRDDE